MAKKKEMTPAERLAAALVPAAEQPYGIPANWQWVRLGSLVNLLRGVSYKKTDVHLPKQENDCLILRGGNIQEGAITFDSDNVYIDKSLVKKEQFVKANDVVIVASTGSVKVIGRAGIVDKDYSDVAFGAFLLLARPRENICKKFVDFYFQNDLYRNRIKRMVSGVNINNIRAEHITEAPFPLPPLAEQQRIVDRIETLFARIDEAEEKLRAAADTFAARRAALLRAAFTGRLTAAWRAARGRSFDEWVQKRLGDCGTWKGGGTPSMHHPEYWENGDLLWITSKDMKTKLIEDTLLHTNMTGVKNSSANYIKEPSVLFVMRSGILRHTFPVAMVKKPFTVNQDLKALSPGSDIELDYLYWACEANASKILSTCMKSGTTVESVSTPALMNYQISVPPLDEQREIVRLLDEAFAEEDRAWQALEAARAAIPALRRAILARAFCGALGTNDPAEPPALPAD